MKFRITLYTLLLLALLSFNLSAQDEFLLQPGTVIKLVDGDNAKQLLMTEDDYTAVLSKFDLQSKTGKQGDAALKDYLEYSAKQVVKWEDSEKDNMMNIMASVSKKISALGLKLNMPAEIQLIKSTMKNEGSSEGYTRGNYIVLKDSRVGDSNDRMENLFMHELFHVLSRYDKTMSEKVYNTMGFKKTNEVKYPPQISDLRISNPDAPFNDFYITVNHLDKPVDVMIILFASKPYEGGSFFSYLQIGLLVVENDGYKKAAHYVDGQPQILKIKEVKNFYEQIGKNSDYIIHAEELSADQFVQLLNQDKDLPNPEIIEAMKKAMK
jgi:hypothetical protein